MKWEYRVTTIDVSLSIHRYNSRTTDDDVLRNELNDEGAQGWELVSVSVSVVNSKHVCIFKRVCA